MLTEPKLEAQSGRGMVTRLGSWSGGLPLGMKGEAFVFVFQGMEDNRGGTPEGALSEKIGNL